jgi:L,D-transpeptidase YcbB
MTPRLRPFITRLLVPALVALAVSECTPKPKPRPAPVAPPHTDVRVEIHRLLAREDSTRRVRADSLRPDTTHLAPPDTSAAALVPQVPDTSDAERSWAQVVAFYAHRHDKPVWNDGRRLRPEAAGFVQWVGDAARSGLDPRDYGITHLEDQLAAFRRSDAFASTPIERSLAAFDVRATEAAFRIARDLELGRAPERVLDPDWVQGRPHAATDVVTRALEHDQLPTALAALEPTVGDYVRLRAALERYRAIAAAGGWGTIGAGEKLQSGARGPRVARLVRRLALTGDLRGSVVDTVLDAKVARAIGDFQSRHGIPRSGVVGEVTQAMLDAPVEQRIRTIELNLERWRWMPRDLGARHIVVNLPAYRLDLVYGDSIACSMRAVVGKRKSPTPVFSDAVTYIELNPTWTVPQSIIVKEVVPGMKRHPDYLQTHHMRVVSWGGDRAAALDPKTIPWKNAASDSFPYLVVEDANPDNPLGRIKFMCPNEYDVYLHDSPAQNYFGAAARDFSHGCVRVAQPLLLADSLLGLAPGDTSAVERLFADGEWKRISLRKPMPVHFFYWTAWVDDSSHAQFRDDLYGLDSRLDSALIAGNWRTFQLNPGVSISPQWLAAQAKALATKDKKKRPATR